MLYEQFKSRAEKEDTAGTMVLIKTAAENTFRTYYLVIIFNTIVFWHQQGFVLL